MELKRLPGLIVASLKLERLFHPVLSKPIGFLETHHNDLSAKVNNIDAKNRDDELCQKSSIEITIFLNFYSFTIVFLIW